MPRFQVKTTSSDKIWSTPDGKMSIYKVTMDYNGDPMTAKTYSDAIAQVGWSGEVETYEKEGKGNNPAETFVKQPPKEGYQGGGSYGGGRPQAKSPVDNYTMYLSYVKDIAVALINTKAYTDERLAEIATAVATTGEMFYEMRPDGSAKSSTAVATSPKLDTSEELNLNDIFPE
jgi:hypothetical protein